MFPISYQLVGYKGHRHSSGQTLQCTACDANVCYGRLPRSRHTAPYIPEEDEEGAKEGYASCIPNLTGGEVSDLVPIRAT